MVLWAQWAAGCADRVSQDRIPAIGMRVSDIVLRHLQKQSFKYHYGDIQEFTSTGKHGMSYNHLCS